MPRLSTPTKPFTVVTTLVKRKKYYLILSDNGYTYHHFDDFWRVYRLKDLSKYTYRNKRIANRKRKDLELALW